jgi:hypothetical protein
MTAAPSKMQLLLARRFFCCAYTRTITPGCALASETIDLDTHA